MSLNCYSPTKRHNASPQKGSSASQKEKPYAALDETQRSHAYRYNIGNNFYREQVDREKAVQTATVTALKKAALDAKPLPIPDPSSTPGTTVTSFMMQLDPPKPYLKENLKLVPDDNVDEMPTDRAMIEDRKERKLLRMMAQQTQTPAHPTPQVDGAEEDTPPNAPRRVAQKKKTHERKVSLPDSTKNLLSKDQNDHVVRKKPTKLSFIPGIGGPPSASAANDQCNPAIAHIPNKAAKILGTSNAPETNPSYKWGFGHIRRKSQKKRTKSFSSLPEKMPKVDEKDITALPGVYPTSTSAEPDRNAAFEETITRIAIEQSAPDCCRIVLEDSDDSLPPTPPAKDTPPHLKAAAAALAQKNKREINGLGIDTAEKDDEVSSIDFGQQTREREKSGMAWVKHGAAEYARLIEASPSMKSMRGSLVYSPAKDRYSKKQYLRPDGLRPDGLRPDGLTKEGHLPQTVYKSQTTYKPYEYSPSLYSTMMKSPQLNDRGKKGRFDKSTSALHTIEDSSPAPIYPNSSELAKRSNTSADFQTHSASDRGSSETLPFIFRYPEPERKRLEDLVERTPIKPPRSSSLNWQTNPPPSARLSLIPRSVRKPSATVSASVTTSNRQANPKLSSNMPHDAMGSSYEEIRPDDKLAVKDSGPGTNGTNGSYPIANSQHGRQPSNSVENAHQRSVGLTPYLAQQLGDNPNPISPGFNHPSAMPSPLAGHFPMAPGIAHGAPSHEQLLTHFHVLHHHIDDTFRASREAEKASQDEILSDNEKNFNNLRSAIDEYFSDVRSHLNAVEHNMARSTGEVEALKTALDTHCRSVDDNVYKPMRKLTNQNTELIKKVDSLQDQVSKLERKFESISPAYGSGDNISGQGVSTQNRPVVDGPLATYNNRTWGGYDAARHMVPGQHSDRHAEYTDVGGRYYNGTDPAQHSNYQNGYYGNGSSYSANNIMREPAVTDDVDANETYEDLSGDFRGWAEGSVSEASTDSCPSEASYRLVRSRRELEELHDEDTFNTITAMFNRNIL